MAVARREESARTLSDHAAKARQHAATAARRRRRRRCARKVSDQPPRRVCKVSRHTEERITTLRGAPSRPLAQVARLLELQQFTAAVQHTTNEACAPTTAPYAGNSC